MKAIAAALAVIAMASTPSVAADLFGTAAPMTFAPQDNPPVEVGSNWYIRGDVGGSLESLPTVTFSGLSSPQGTPSTPLPSYSGGNERNFAGDVGVGYRFNNYLRFDATYEYRLGTSVSATTTATCPYTATNVVIGGMPVGYLYDTTNTCNGALSLQQHSQTGLANAYLDLGTYWHVTPYIGGGAGLNVASTSGSMSFVQTNNGQTYAADLTATGGAPYVWVDKFGNKISPQPGVSFSPQNWNSSVSSTKYSLAIALMAGVGIQISPSATLDIGYRYLNTGATTLYVTSPVAAAIKTPDYSQEFKIGIRYMAD